MTDRRLLERLAVLPDGHSRGLYRGRPYGVTITRSADRKRFWLYGEELGGNDVVSANLYVLADGSVLLKPCEMDGGKVRAFIEAYEPDAAG